MWKRHHRSVVWSLVWVLGYCLPALAQQNPTGQLSLAELEEPRLLLVRDPVVIRDLKLDRKQTTALQPVHDEIDRVIWPVRQRNAQEVTTAWQAAAQIWTQRGETLLTPSQRLRLDEIVLRTQGPTALRRDDIAQKLQLSGSQRKEIAETFAEANKRYIALQKRADEGEASDVIQREYAKIGAEGQQRIVNVLSEDQLGDWAELLGGPIPVDQLGRVAFRWPGILGDADDWIQGAPDSEGPWDGKVRVIHFFAFGCVNCVRNYEAYRTWHQQFADRGVVVVGIHTPETDRERERAALIEKLKSDRLPFPMLMDNDRQNWNAWGNAMWPSVYLVDRQGRIRAWWYGELNWQGANGQTQLTERIEQLLAEP